jgi:hypothetical protein
MNLYPWLQSRFTKVKRELSFKPISLYFLPT